MNKSATSLGSRYAGYLYIAVPMVLVVTIIIIPFGQAIYYSFTKFSAMSPPVWVGLHNYSKLLQTPLFLSSIKNNALIALASPLFVFCPWCWPPSCSGTAMDGRPPPG